MTGEGAPDELSPKISESIRAQGPPAYPDYIAVLMGAKIRRRAMHWMSTRSDAFLSVRPGTRWFTEAELAVRRAGGGSSRANSPSPPIWRPISVLLAPSLQTLNSPPLPAWHV